MSRFLSLFGYLLGGAGVTSGVAFLITRHAALLRAATERRDPWALMKWQLSEAVGITVIFTSVLLALIFVALGRILARLDDVERAVAAQRGVSAPAVPSYQSERAAETSAAL